MVYASIIGCILLAVLTWQKSKDIIAPSFILSSIWTVLYFVLLLRRNTVNLSSIYYSSFFVALLCFTMGFFFIVGNKRKEHSVEIQLKEKMSFNISFIRVALLIEIILFFYFLLKVGIYVSGNYSFNIFQTLSIGKTTGMFDEGIIISYSRNAIISFSVVCGIVFFNNPIKRNRNYFLISFIIALFFSLTAGNRGIIFMLVLALFFSNIIIKKYSNKKIAIMLLLIVLIILVTFISFAYMKYVYEDRSDTTQFIMKQLRVYFSTSMIAFVQWIETTWEYKYGANTFRFFAELLNGLGYDLSAVKAVQEYVYVYGDITNVYSVLHYYTSDYGLIYAFVIQVILGMTYGFIYKKAIINKKTTPFFIAVLSILYFPLINQFFDDKYFSILSTWIQLIFWIAFFTRRKFLYLHANEDK
ncbi:O-antigen polymerase [Paenibacillus sp. FSL P4-0338]|uniref:O-antigen polymerase n=1 Tax=Paenibacillus sp. FSL P4-0338 TaxID=2921635 RepID=UPI0030F51988